MKTLLTCVGAMALGLFAGGCATPMPVGTIYTNVKLPAAVTSNTGSQKVGTATCASYVSVVSIGDASIEAAKKNGGITKVSHVDWEAKNILGIIGKYKTTVYGE